MSRSLLFCMLAFWGGRGVLHKKQQQQQCCFPLKQHTAECLTEVFKLSKVGPKCHFFPPNFTACRKRYLHFFPNFPTFCVYHICMHELCYLPSLPSFDAKQTTHFSFQNQLFPLVDLLFLTKVLFIESLQAQDQHFISNRS